MGSNVKAGTGVYVIIADGSVDQMVTELGHAKREARDLRLMGCDVRIKTFATWQDAERYEDTVRGY